MSIGIGFLLFLSVVLIALGFVFIYGWRKSPSNYEGASSAEMAKYLRRSDRNALLGVLFVFWTSAALMIAYSLYSLRPG
ncbi:MAG: hypothetical protein U0516_01930 [Candidatus Saccharibacteria bacterium]